MVACNIDANGLQPFAVSRVGAFGPASSDACARMCFHIPNVLYELRNEFNLLVSFIPYRIRNIHVVYF